MKRGVLTRRRHYQVIEREAADQTNLDYMSTRRPDPAPPYTPAIKMKDYSLSQRFAWVKMDPPKLGEVLTMRDVERLFRMPKRGAQRLVQRYLVPVGGVEKLGRSYRVHAWAVRKLVGVHDG